MTRNAIGVMSLVVGMTIFAQGGPSQAAALGSNGIFFGSSVPSTDTVDNNAVLTGDKVTLDGSVNGDVLAVGNEIDVNGTVQGSLIAIAQRVVMNGKVSGSTYSTALEMNVKPAAAINENLFYAGTSLISEKGSQIKRDLYARSLGAQLAGSVGRNTQAIIGPVNLLQALANSLGIGPSSQPPPSSAPQSSTPEDPGFAVVPVQYRMPSHPEAAAPAQIDTASLSAWAIDRLKEFLSLALVGLLAIWRLPALFFRGAAVLRKRPLASAGYGIFDLVLAVNLSGVILLIIILALTVGLWLGPRTSWALSGAVWGIGFFGAGLAVILLWLFVFFVAKAIVGYYGGKLILDRLSPKSTPNRAFPLLIGLVIITLIASIPTIGWILDIVIIALGLGATWLAYRQRAETPAAVEARPAAREPGRGGATAYPVPVSGDSPDEQ